MTTSQLGQPMDSTILGGVVLLIHHGSYPIAAVIFIASVMVPISKLVAITWLAWTVSREQPTSHQERTRLYRAAELVGKWSMTDVFVVAILVVSLDNYPHAEPAEMGTYAGRPTIPAVESGFQGIQVQLTALLAKLNALPLEDVAESAAEGVANLNSVLASRQMQELPATVESTLVELRGVLESVSLDSAMQDRLMATMTELDRTVAALRSVLTTLDDQPNSVIFPRDLPDDPVLPAGTP